MNNIINFENFKKVKEDITEIEAIKKRIAQQKQEFIEMRYNLTISKKEFEKVISQLKTYMIIQGIKFEEGEKLVKAENDMTMLDIKISTSSYDNMEFVNFLKNNQISFKREL